MIKGRISRILTQKITSYYRFPHCLARRETPFDITRSSRYFRQQTPIVIARTDITSHTMRSSLLLALLFNGLPLNPALATPLKTSDSTATSFQKTTELLPSDRVHR